MKSFESYLIYEEVKNNDTKFTFTKYENEIIIECEYCSFIIEIKNISYKTKQNKEVLSGKELVTIIENAKNGQITYNDIKSLLLDKVKDFEEIYDEAKDDPYCYVLDLKNVKLCPPKADELEKLNVEIYQLFDLELRQEYGVNVPKITFGDLVISNIGKINTKEILASYIKISGSLFFLLFNLCKTLSGAKKEDLTSFKKLNNIIIKEIKKSINNNLKEINSLPDKINLDIKIKDIIMKK